jgi:hypothetical protein
MATKNTPATETTIPVRLNLLVQIDPAKWTVDAPAGVDADKVIAGLVAAGIPEDTAKEMAATLTAAPAANGPAAVRTAVREYLLGAVRGLEKLAAAGATIVDADRQPKAAK